MEEKKTQSTYKRSLTNAHIQLIALGGTIGTGLFLGVGNSIQKAGPAVILIYIIVGLFLFILMRALGELILSDLKKHTYIEFIEKYVSSRRVCYKTSRQSLHSYKSHTCFYTFFVYFNINICR